MENNCELDFNNDEWVDYPYIGVGEKPGYGKHKVPTEDQLEKIIGG